MHKKIANVCCWIADRLVSYSVTVLYIFCLFIKILGMCNYIYFQFKMRSRQKFGKILRLKTRKRIFLY